MLLSVLSGLVLALFAPWLYRLAGRATGLLLGVAVFAMAGYYVAHVADVSAGRVFQESRAWLALLDVDLSMRLDGLSLVFALIVTVIGGLVLLYSSRYMIEYPQQGRFYGYMMFFLASMLGVVLSDNLIVLVVFWELTSVSSFLLIGFENNKPAARRAALQSLVITGGAGLALLAGLILLIVAGGSADMHDLLERGRQVRGSDLYVAIVILVLIGAAAKSAQWPFHVWLPAAMHAPSPVSAYLHSAAMVKAGVYLLARLQPVLGGTDLWHGSVGTVGLVSMLVGAWWALGQTDLKRMLAYSTVSVLGVLVMLIGLGDAAALRAMVVYLVAHALYKSSLFLMAGMVDHETGTRDIRRLSGLGRALPLSAAVGGIAALSLAGVPLTFGFAAKELLLEAGLHAERLARVYTAGAVLGSVSMVAVAAVCGVRLFWSRARSRLEHAPHRASPWMSLPALVLALGGVVLGVWPALVDDWLLDRAASVALGAPALVSLHVWPVVGTALGLSLAALAGGLLVYWQLVRVRRLVRATARWLPAALADWYGAMVRGLNDLAYAQTRALQNGSLRGYIMITCLATIGLVGYTLLHLEGLAWPASWPQVDPHRWALIIVLTASWVAILFIRQMLSMVAALGAIGFAVALVFALHGGIDLAITQVSVETLSVLLFVLVLYRLPREAVLEIRWGRLGGLAVALGVGVLIAAMLLSVVSQPAASRIAPYYLAEALPRGHGHNVVTVILVDYRALDTMVEITVLAVASMGVLALLRLRPARAAPPEIESRQAVPSTILVTASQYLLPLLLLLSVFLTLRGHEEPGGGFVGGLVGGMAFVLYAVARNVQRARQALRIHPRHLVSAGLLLAVGSGLAGLAAGSPFLTGLWYAGAAGVPTHAGTPIVLDLAVYLVVIGSVLTIFFNLAEVS